MPLPPLNFEPIYAKNVAYGRLYNNLNKDDTLIILFDNDNLPSCDPPQNIEKYEGIDTEEYLNNPNRKYHLTLLDSNCREIVEVHSDPNKGGTPAYVEGGKKYITVKRRVQDTDTSTTRSKVWEQNALVKLNVTAEIANRLNEVAYENYNITKDIVEGNISHDGITIEQQPNDYRTPLTIIDNYNISNNTDRQSLKLESNFSFNDTEPLDQLRNGIPAAHIQFHNREPEGLIRSLYSTDYDQNEKTFASIELRSKISSVKNTNYEDSNYQEDKFFNKITSKYSIYTIDLDQQNILTEKFRIDDFGGIGIGLGGLKSNLEVDSLLHIFGSSEAEEYGTSSVLKPVIKLTDYYVNNNSLERKDVVLQNWMGHFIINDNIIENSTNYNEANLTLTPDGELSIKSGINLKNNSGETISSIKIKENHPSTNSPYLLIGEDNGSSYTETQNNPSTNRINFRGVLTTSNCFEGPIGISKDGSTDIEIYPGRFSKLEIVKSRAEHESKIIIEPDKIKAESPLGNEVTLEGGIFVDGYISGGFKTLNMDTNGKLRWFKDGKTYLDYRTDEQPDSEYNESLFSSHITGGWDSDLEKQFIDIKGNLRVQNLAAKNNLYIDLDIFPEEEGYHKNEKGEEEADIKIGMSPSSPLIVTKWGRFDSKTNQEITTISIGNDNEGIGFWRNQPNVQKRDIYGNLVWTDETQLVPVWETENKLETIIKTNTKGDLAVEGNGIRLGLKGTEEWWDKRKLVHERESYSRLMWEKDDDYWNMTENENIVTVGDFSYIQGDHRWNFEIRKVPEEPGIIREWNWQNPVSRDMVNIGSVSGWERDTWDPSLAKNPSIRIDAPTTIHKQIKITAPIQDREYDNDSFSTITNWFLLQAPVTNNTNSNEIYQISNCDISVYNSLPNELEDRTGWYPDGDYRNCDYTNPTGTNYNDPDPGNYKLVSGEKKYRKNYQTLSRFEEIPDPTTIEVNTGKQNNDGSINYQTFDNYIIQRSSTVTFNKFSYGDLINTRWYSGTPTEEYVRRTLSENIDKQPEWIQKRGLEKTAPNRLVADLSLRNPLDSVNGTEISMNLQALFQNHDPLNGAPENNDDRLARMQYGISHVDLDLIDDSIGTRYSIGKGSDVEGEIFERSNDVKTRHLHGYLGMFSNHPLMLTVGGVDRREDFKGLENAFKKSMPVDSPTNLSELNYFTNLIGMYIKNEKYKMLDVKVRTNEPDYWDDDRWFASVYIPSLSTVRYGNINDFDPDDPNCPKDSDGNPNTSVSYKLFTPDEPSLGHNWQELLPVYVEDKTGRLVLNPDDIKYIEEEENIFDDLTDFENRLNTLENQITDLFDRIDILQQTRLEFYESEEDDGTALTGSGYDLIHFTSNYGSDKKLYAFDAANSLVYTVVELDKTMDKISFDNNGQLYSLTNNGWWKINYNTGETEELNHYEDDNYPEVISINPLDNNSFGFNRNTLYKIDTISGIIKKIKNFDKSLNIKECAFDILGNLKAINKSDDKNAKLYTFDTGTAENLKNIIIGLNEYSQLVVINLDNESNFVSLGIDKEISCLAFSKQKDLYGSGLGQVYKINRFTGESSSYLDFSHLHNGYLNCLGFDKDNNLYGGINNKIYLLNNQDEDDQLIINLDKNCTSGFTFDKDGYMYLTCENEILKISIDNRSIINTKTINNTILKGISIIKEQNKTIVFDENSKKLLEINLNDDYISSTSMAIDYYHTDLFNIDSNIINMSTINESSTTVDENNNPIFRIINEEIISDINEIRGLCYNSSDELFTTYPINYNSSKLIKIAENKSDFISAIYKGNINSLTCVLRNISNENKGFITVNIKPEEAIISDAMWSVGDDDVWYESGTRVRINSGVNFIKFKQLSEWDKPDNIDFEIEDGGILNLSGEYIKNNVTNTSTHEPPSTEIIAE
jgi:hypothetical protein